MAGQKIQKYDYAACDYFMIMFSNVEHFKEEQILEFQFNETDFWFAINIR